MKVLRGLVARVPAADPAETVARLSERFRFETDCADVASDLSHGVGGFVVVDARSPEKFAAGHVPGAVNLPTRTITAESTKDLDPQTLHITYCSGPHCNGSTRAALRLAELGFRVKEMIGGFHHWRLDGHPVDQ
ncbi:rhodanese-like domain-containing protein [Cryptosporangium phraense]|uniref:Rhodanese-like domain-containing protein n=1 Tax=Cryptosporangium phraense TaxID=2593070 RepID=A0A545AFA6_9ACTN|nr:rhodanese-like domain-containing protein [Cryptosporangium phraense]TQS40017.1 rhodanese-like domain-containing protein [Cryptosporangium phraense]